VLLATPLVFARHVTYPTSHFPSRSSASPRSRRVYDPYVLLATPLGFLPVCQGRYDTLTTRLLIFPRVYDPYVLLFPSRSRRVYDPYAHLATPTGFLSRMRM
jgi:hypothetical protein